MLSQATKVSSAASFVVPPPGIAASRRECRSIMSPEIVQKRDPAAVRRILESLPDWFGDPGAIDNYVTAAGDIDFVRTIVVDSGNVIGVSLTRRHFRDSAELHLVAGGSAMTKHRCAPPFGGWAPDLSRWMSGLRSRSRRLLPASL